MIRELLQNGDIYSKLSSFRERVRSFRERADKFLVTKRGAYLRTGLLFATVGVYPVWKLVLTGPLLNTTFGWRVSIDPELPEHVVKAINEQSFFWMEKTGRAEKDSLFNFACQKNASLSLDSVRIGSMSTKHGAQIALPFYAKFATIDDAYKFAKEHLEPFNVLGKVVCIVWESDVGKQLLSTFVLSDEALAFLITRDLFGVEQRYLLNQEGLTWFCHTFTYMLIFYVLHTLWLGGGALSFVILFSILFSISLVAAKYWNELAIYINEHRADLEAAKLSTRHTMGGKEYYTKILLRNRLLRELIKGGDKLFTEVGDYRKAIADYVVRFDEMKRVQSDNEQLTLSIEGDDLPGQI